jgi:predicted O-methyltransferase YrrM
LAEQENQPVELSLVGKAIRNARIVARTSFSTYRMSRAACEYGACQKWIELTGLAHLVRKVRPLRTLEIGVYQGGTIALWAQLIPTNGTLIGVDFKFSEGIENRIRAKMKTGQSLHLLEGNSHTIETRAQLFGIIGNDNLDFLFIDGDHSYEGVSQDFKDYSPLVRPGGMVAFHDILPDDSTSFGVYQFWSEIKTHYRHREFIEDSAQHGCGIGVLHF